MKNKELNTAATRRSRKTGRKERETVAKTGDNGRNQAKIDTTETGREPKKSRKPALAIVGSSKGRSARRCSRGAVVGCTGSACHAGTAIGTQFGHQRAVVVSFRSNQAAGRPSFR